MNYKEIKKRGNYNDYEFIDKILEVIMKVIQALVEVFS